MRARHALVSLLLAAPIFAGCLAPDEGVDAATAGLPSLTPYPYDAAFDTSGEWSRTLVNGTLGRLPVEEVVIPSFDGTKLHMGVFRPDVPEGVKVPVIVDAGPYYGDGDEPALSDRTHRLGGFLIENFVPHGYAVVQASVRGTGLSGGCMDYMGEKEQRDLDAVVTYLGEAEWSNGRVGMIGRSYDGSTPWEAATFGNPYLRTIVPISGITDLQQLHYRNGSAELRSPILGALYYSYGATNAGLDGPEEDPARAARMACLEGPLHAPMGAYGYATGGGHTLPGPTSDYWTKRSFTERVLQGYNGSIFYIHGLQDWNVKPSQGVDVYNAFEGKKKALLGQWAHNYPDRPGEHEHLRWDWAEMLLRWFDSELKGVPGVDTGPAVEVEDHRSHWRAEPDNAWPPLDAAWTPVFPGLDGKLVASGAAGGAVTLFAPAHGAEPFDAQEPLPPVPGFPATAATVPEVWFETEPFANETVLSGMPQLHLTVVPLGAGGHLYARLYEVPADGEPVLVGRAQMDLRYAAGGRAPQPVVPQQPLVAMMEFYPLDARILPGSRLALQLTQEVGVDPLPSAETGPVEVRLGDDQSVLRLPVVDRPFVPSRWDVAGAEVKRETA